MDDAPAHRSLSESSWLELPNRSPHSQGEWHLAGEFLVARGLGDQFL